MQASVFLTKTFGVNAILGGIAAWCWVQHFPILSKVPPELLVIALCFLNIGLRCVSSRPVGLRTISVIVPTLTGPTPSRVK